MIGHRFIQFNPNENNKTKFEQMLDIFMQLLTYTNGDAAEALSWMNELDKQYEFTNDTYGMGDFIDTRFSHFTYGRKYIGPYGSHKRFIEYERQLYLAV